MVILRDLSIYWGMIHAIVLFTMLFRPRLARKKTLLAVGAGMGILMAANGIGLALCGIDTLSKMFPFTCSIPGFIFFYMISADRRFKFLFSFSMADTACLWIMAATSLMDYYLGGGHYVLMFASRLIAFPLVEYLVWRYLRKPYLELQDAVEQGWGIFAGMTMLYYALLAAAVQFPANTAKRPEDTLLCVLVLILIVFNYGVIFSALYRQLQLYRRQQSERILQEQKQLLEAQLENRQHIRRMKHDMRAHMVTISGLIAAGKMVEASLYLKNAQTELDRASGQFCANIYLNAVFGHYYRRFQELGTELMLDIRVGDEELPCIELCQILSNGLENAWDASRVLSPELREASVRMTYNRDYLLIRIRNRCRKEFTVEKGTIPKAGKRGSEHGFGLLTIQEAAGRLNGEMSCYTESGYFVLDVMVWVNVPEGNG